MQSLKSAKFEVSDSRGQSCTRVLFDVYDAVIVLIPLTFGLRTQACVRFCLRK